MAQQYFTIPSTGVYGTYKFYQNDQIPMELAVELGIEGAELAEGDYFSSEEQTAIREVVGNRVAWADTMHPSNGSSGVPGQITYLMRPLCGRLVRAQTFTKARVFNQATVAGNHAISIWTSDGTTATRIAGTGSVAQSGANAVQTHNLTFTIPADTDWFISFSSDSTTATYLRQNNWAGTMKTAAGDIRSSVIGAYNVTANQTLASLSASLVTVWVEVS